MPNFTIQAGKPWARRIRVVLPADRDYWLTTSDFEVLMQVRKEQDEDSLLFADLAQYLTTSMEGTVIVINWLMTGHVTRSLTGGFYDMWVSDPGTTDARAEPILAGKVTMRPVVTAETEDTTP